MSPPSRGAAARDDPPEDMSNPASEPHTPQGLLIDTTRCIGCGACSLACAERNGLPVPDTARRDADLSDRAFTVVRAQGGRFVRRLCMHCDEPTCASVCLVGAFRKTAGGPVVYDESRCIGCRYCMQACPFTVPRYEWDKVLPRVRKCDLCAPRLAEGRPTACAAACPTGATRFGPRDALLAEARARIAAEPGRYLPQVYGAVEAGGTSVLLISDVPFAALGYPDDLPHEALPALTWRVMSQVPRFAVTAGVFLAGVYWITNRREEVAAEQGRPAPGAGPDAGREAP
jgi:formate dehydrogenase iron-sulfur subunit